jgi:thiol:disulfide interchange protein DsbD
MQWHLIERETFFLIWTLLGAATFAYLMGWIRFPHDSPIKKLSTPRMIFAGIFLAFTVYIAPGMLKERPWSHDLLSGFPPPFCTAHDSYSWYADICESTYHPEFDDFYAAQQKATELGKPILIDFTGWACVNCRKMEETVWTEPQIREILENEKKIRTIGNKWATFQTHAFRNNSQPYYVMLSPDGTLLGNPVGYTPEASEYQEYLECGISTYRGIQQSASIK